MYIYSVKLLSDFILYLFIFFEIFKIKKGKEYK